MYEKAGGCVLKWIVEGAYKYIESEMKLEFSTIINDAIKIYREENDWLENFISERCIIGKELKEESGLLYTEYRKYASRIGEFPKGNRDFYKALEGKGYKKHRTPKIRYICGLALCSKSEKEIEPFPFIQYVTDDDREFQDIPKVEF